MISFVTDKVVDWINVEGIKRVVYGGIVSLEDIVDTEAVVKCIEVVASIGVVWNQVEDWIDVLDIETVGSTGMV